MTDSPARIGVITTGHGPRDEYIRYHSAILRFLGAEVEIVARHALDGLSMDELRPHIVGPERPNIGAHVHVPGATGNRMGPGWQHLFFDLDFCISRFQQAIQAIEEEDGANIVVLACAAEFPPGSLRAITLLVHPREILFSYAENLAWGAARKIRVGVLVDAEHAPLDQAEWARKPWYDRIELFMAPITRSLQEVARTLSDKRLDLGYFWGYGAGLVEGDPRDQVRDLERVIGAPLLVPHRATALFLRNLIRPSIDDRSFA